MAQATRGVGVEIAKEAIEFTLYAGRRTVRVKDIKAAHEKTYKSKRPYHIKT